MNRIDGEWAYRLATLLEQDVTDVVDMLQITTEEIVEKFPEYVNEYLLSEFDLVEPEDDEI